MDYAAGLAEDLDGTFPDVVRAWEDGVFSTTLRLTGHYHDAEDITQETFVRVYRALGRLSSDEIRALKVRPYVWKTAVNLCRNRWRSRSRKPETGLPDISTLPATDRADVTIELDEWQRRLEKLSHSQRAAVVLRHVAGLSYAEVARVMDVPVGTAKAHVHRGIARLRQLIEAEQGVIAV